MNAVKEREPSYKIFVLDNDEYEGLLNDMPELKENKSFPGSLGFANPKAKEAFIRRTGFKDWDDQTIIHEAQELIAKVSPHEEDGLRFKSGGDIVKTIVAPIAASILTGGLAGAAGIGSTMSGILSGGAGALTSGLTTGGKPSQYLPGAILSGISGGLLGSGASGGVQAAQTANKGFLGTVGSGIKGAFGIGTTGSGTAKTTIGSGEASSLGGTLKGYAGGATSVNPLATQALGNLGNVSSQTVSPAVQTQAATQATKAQEPFKLTDLLKGKNLLGTTALVGSMLPSTPTYEMPSSVSDIYNKLISGSGLTSLGTQARTELQSILSSEPTEIASTTSDAYYQSITRRIEENYATALEELDKAYNLAGVYGSGEHLQARADLQEELAQTKSDIAAQIEQQRYELAVTQKYQAIQQALGVDSEVMNDLVGLTGLDVQTAAMIYGADVADVQAIREALGTLGTELILRGTTGYSPTSGISINLGG